MLPTFLLVWLFTRLNIQSGAYSFETEDIEHPVASDRYVVTYVVV